MINKKILAAAIIAAPLCVLTGCATMISGSDQNLHIQAIDAQTHQMLPGATCNVTDANGVTTTVTSNPGNVNLARGKGPLQVKCTNAGYKQSQIGVGSSFNAWTILDVLFWPAFIVDGLDGSYSKYDHSFVTVLMTKDGSPYVPAKVGTIQQKSPSTNTTQ